MHTKACPTNWFDDIGLNVCDLHTHQSIQLQPIDNLAFVQRGIYGTESVASLPIKNYTAERSNIDDFLP